MYRLNGFELVESMHVFAPEGEVVLILDVALKFLHHMWLTKIIFPVSAPDCLNCVHAPKTQTNTQNKTQDLK
jgi:hypothetical protein